MWTFVLTVLGQLGLLACAGAAVVLAPAGWRLFAVAAALAVFLLPVFLPRKAKVMAHLSLLGAVARALEEQREQQRRQRQEQERQERERREWERSEREKRKAAAKPFPNPHLTQWLLAHPEQLVNKRGSDLSGLDLSETLTYGVDFSGANLAGIQASDKHFYNSLLVGAKLHRAILVGTTFADADLTDADLSFALLYDANLKGAKNILTANLVGTEYDAGTVWPDGFSATDARKRGAVEATIVETVT